MAKIRYIDPGICLSETVAKLSYRQRDLWIRLILIVDDQGRCPANPLLIRSSVWPLDSIELPDIAEDMKILENNGFIFTYESDGKNYLQIQNWQKYQRHAQWLGMSKYPSPVGWKDRWRYHGKGRQIYQSENWNDTCRLPNDLNEQIDLLPNDLKMQQDLLPNHLNAHNRQLPSQDGDGNVEKDEDFNTEEEKNNLIEDKKTEIQIITLTEQLIPPSNEQYEIWNEIVSNIKNQVSRSFFDAYFKSIDLVGVRNDIFTFKAINKFTAILIIEKFGSALRRHLEQSFEKKVKIEFYVPGI